MEKEIETNFDGFVRNKCGDFEIDGDTLIRYNGDDGDVIIPNGIKIIGEHAFQWCIDVESVVIPNSVKRIYSYAFRNCRSLESVTIPDSVRSIRSYAFDYCVLLEVVTFSSTTPPLFGGFIFTNCDALTTIYVPSASLDAYKTASFFECYASKIVGY